MENKKLIKTIKKRVLKQFESDLKDSILKELYESASKKDIKKIRKQILLEIQEELFGAKNDTKTNVSDFFEKNYIHTNTVNEKDLENKSSEESIELTEEQGTQSYEPGKIFEYGGLKFDVDRMSSIVTGKKKNRVISEPGIERVESVNDKLDGKPLTKPTIESPLKSSSIKDRIFSIKNGVHKQVMNTMVSKELFPDSLDSFRYAQNFNVGTGIPNNIRLKNTFSPSKNVVNTVLENITPSNIEEISFFVEKLKKSVDTLGRGEKNIMYRKKKDDIYTFSFEKNKLSKDDFSLKFDFDLNMYTYGAVINTFSFNIDGFNFDKGFVEIFDIIEVLEVSGINLMKYINEINEINDTAASLKSKIKDNLKKNSEAIRANTNLSKVIFDDKILRVLQSNDINTYGQLQKIEDLTSLKGVGEKTANKIEKYIKNN